MYSIFDCKNTFFGGHSLFVEQTDDLDAALDLVSNSQEDLRIYLSEEADRYLDGDIDNISPLN